MGGGTEVGPFDGSLSYDLMGSGAKYGVLVLYTVSAEDGVLGAVPNLADIDAHAAVVSAVSAAAIERVLIESLIISFSPNCLACCLEQTTNAILASIRRVFSPQHAP